MIDHDDRASSFWCHIDELRQVLVRTFAIIAIAFVFCLPFYQPLFAFFVQALDLHTPRTQLVRTPLQQDKIYNSGRSGSYYRLESTQEKVIDFSLGVEDQGSRGWHIPPQGYLTIEKNVPRETLAIFHPLEGLSTAFKICFWVSIVATSPFWLFLLFHFCLPALNKQERSLAIPFFAGSLLCFSIGIAVAYYITIPIAVHSLQYFNEGLGTNLWGITNTLDFLLFIFFSNGLAFESCIILFFLIHLQVIGADFLVTYRRHAIVLIFLAAALLTPPDILTQLLLAIPLMAIYEAAILYARLIQYKPSSQEEVFIN